MMEEGQDFPLPALASHLKLSRAPDDGGEPAYTIHNPVSNTYFKIDWMAFECLSRFPLYNKASELKAAVENETTLSVTIGQIWDIAQFLSQNGLLSLHDQNILNKAEPNIPLWKKIFHQYLYFSIPLFKPQAFLERTYPRISWLYHPLFLKGMMVFLAIMVLFTLPRIDEFLHTFSAMISAEGAISALIVFCFVKIVHEFAHAYTAVRYGVKVPHMGIAFMVMYPVLYTETTGSWALSSRRARFHIGLAGIVAELCLAAIFLVVWHVSPSGSMAQSLSFLVVAVSLISSLLVNLNPLMRFDGYYLVSDASGFDNLQQRACAFARHKLRKVLFGWSDAAPEDISDADKKFLTVFGASLIIYRFFLFMGIAVLVYHIFFQPLGFILMMAELVWFIFLPIYSELKIWWQNKNRIVSSRRSFIPGAVLAAAILFVLVPWKTTVSLPAVIHAGTHESLYPPSPARIVSLNVVDGEEVEEGDILAQLDSPELSYKIDEARFELERLETLKRRGQNMVEAMQSNALSDVAIEKARIKLKGLLEQQARLQIRAPFGGVVRDLDDEITEGRYVFPTDRLFTVVDPETSTVTAYATEQVREKITGAKDGVFVSEFRTTRLEGLNVRRVSDTGENVIQWTELSSVFGGPIPADHGPEGEITGRRALYEVTAEGDMRAPAIVQRGYLHVSSKPSSYFVSWIKHLISIFWRESNVG